LFPVDHEWKKNGFAGASFVGGKAGEAIAAVNHFLDLEVHVKNSKYEFALHGPEQMKLID
jgi:hypothetical protein